MARERTVRDLPHAVESGGLASRLSGRRPAVFLDYDGVLTPIVDRPEDAGHARHRLGRWRGASRCASSAVATGRSRMACGPQNGFPPAVGC